MQPASFCCISSIYACAQDIIIEINIIAIGANRLCRSDRKYPDGCYIMSWTSGKMLVWDATCLNTYAPTHIQGKEPCSEAGAAALKNEQ